MISTISIERTIKKAITDNLYKGYGIVIYGARRVGKTTLVRQIQSESNKKSVYINCDESVGQSALSAYNSLELRKNTGIDTELLIIDEAQRIVDIGIKLKLLIDNYPELQIIATGSSSFDLSNKIKEPLTGRVIEYTLYPFSIAELSQHYNRLELQSIIDTLLVYGSYPRSVFGPLPGPDLINVADNYLYKDILEYNNIRKPELLKKIITLLANDIGSELSIVDMTNRLDIRRETLESYITLLEQSFVIYPLLPYSTNLRSELTKKKKVFFYDNGIRNAILGNLNHISTRGDFGKLWEQFMISQMYIQYKNSLEIENQSKFNFWRTTDQHQEVDLIISDSHSVAGYEFCYSAKMATKKKKPSQFTALYPDASYHIIHSENFLDFLL